LSTSRDLWVLFETYHDVTYFTPESRAATDALGCKGGWMGYFGMRAAPLGAAAPELVVATFYNFHPWMVRRAIPDAWQIAPPEQFLEARLAGAGGALKRMLGSALDDIDELVELAQQAAAAAPIAGRPLGAANAALDVPKEPHLALWQATTVLRESRGDGHVATLVAAPLDPVETLVLFAAEQGIPYEYMQKARGWSEEEWTAARGRLSDRGLLADGAVTEAGKQLRADIEQRTDELAEVPWRTLGQEKTQRLAELLRPLAKSLAQQNEAMRVNPMAIDAASILG
jgi:Helix-turn-helix family